MRTYVFMKALPPTTGHRDLINFAKTIAYHKWFRTHESPRLHVVIDTAADEPFVDERVNLIKMLSLNCVVHHLQNAMEDPAAPGFWDYWHGVLTGLGVEPGDYIVGSELYCKELARSRNAVFVPYDIERQMNVVKASIVREDPYQHFQYILPEFQKHLQTRITIFGAESTGKTTLAKKLGRQLFKAQFVPEYARSYLENTENIITPNSMTAIWMGQKAFQKQFFKDKPVIIQDTDLFSTYGYWQYFQMPRSFIDYQARLSMPAPHDLLLDARLLKSDLYIITPAVIPFEPDPLRYGVDHREISDNWWIEFAYRKKLNYLVLPDDTEQWTDVARDAIMKIAKDKMSKLAYERIGQ